ncbi:MULTISPECIES: LysR family transcriptional regulator [unclassified Bradyrhizobium]|uniref:LysR family transcriptional regulator n=1 Tax=unclassified Bradyrhizobium TaxID=2631580 RepID=UPI0020B1AD7D|nr:MULTISPECIES: LysR family transcriptional regulator [unclassified Bradyrhizobium]MCP3397801.1 LysR family transcriptional regulator [Bradyrhizobium sp. CCGB20]MCP3401941.1 LysR family transcriptional regulator [Bradyrhizobium sp. CCGB20]MCP3406390.1 LysR family transcriptional regulator [Bradyrhizobium sp. CCGB01]MCP3410426.1 LysR family transcriptional regulator [Bradyrhizobium sp. CCGB01]
MNLRSIDLNLLVILDALLTERNVSRAGERIGLSQSAMSAALARLREVFHDPLLVRVGRDLALTRNAEDLIVPLKESLSKVEHLLLRRPGFDPATDARTFSISASDYAGLVLLTPLVRMISNEAPNVTIHLLPRARDAARVLQTNQADIVIEPIELFGPNDYPTASLLSDRWLCAVDANHPDVTGDILSETQFLELPHLVYGIGDDRQLNLADQHLANAGVQRRIEVTVESFLLSPFLIKGTRLISLVLERAARRLIGTVDIKLLESPISVPDIHEAMYWHPRHTTDPAHKWLREKLLNVAQQLD